LVPGPVFPPGIVNPAGDLVEVDIREDSHYHVLTERVG
jgi:hypothetical protein